MSQSPCIQYIPERMVITAIVNFIIISGQSWQGVKTEATSGIVYATFIKHFKLRYSFKCPHSGASHNLVYFLCIGSFNSFSV